MVGEVQRKRVPKEKKKRTIKKNRNKTNHRSPAEEQEVKRQLSLPAVFSFFFFFFELYSLNNQSAEILFSPPSSGFVWCWLTTSYQFVTWQADIL